MSENTGMCGKHPNSKSITWRIKDGGILEFCGYGEMDDYGTWEYAASWAYSDMKVYTVRIGEGITAIGQYAFAGCRKLRQVELPNSLRRIGKHAFENCVCLESVVLPKDICEIESSVFKGCTMLQSVVLPRNLQKIRRWAFQGCAALKGLLIPLSVTMISSTAFADIDLDTPGLLKSERFQIVNHCLYDIQQRCVITGNDVEDIILPPDTEVIEEYAFYKHKRITEIDFSASVRVIKKYAFAQCLNLRTVRISRQVNVVGERVFDGSPWVHMVWAKPSLRITDYSSMSAVDRLQQIACSRFDATAIANGRLIGKIGGKIDLSQVAFRQDITQICSEMDFFLAIAADHEVVLCRPPIDNTNIVYPESSALLRSIPWSNKRCVLVSASENFYTILYADGTVYSNLTSENGWKKWTGIVQCATSWEAVYGLDCRGHVHVSSKDSGFFRDVLSTWSEVIQIDVTGCYYCNPLVTALRRNGDVYCSDSSIPIDDVHDAIQVSSGNHYILALLRNGTVLMCNAAGCKLLPWQNIVAIHGGFDNMYGLTGNGELLSIPVKNAKSAF